VETEIAETGALVEAIEVVDCCGYKSQYKLLQCSKDAHRSFKMFDNEIYHFAADFTNIEDITRKFEIISDLPFTLVQYEPVLSYT